MSAMNRALLEWGARTLRFLTLGAAFSTSFALGLGACESATNLDVVYGDASTAPDARNGALDGGAGDAAAPITPALLPGCPCEESAGLGCCMPGAGTPFCTGDTSACAAAKGTYLRCTRPDPGTESVCCWHGSGAGAVTALASACDGGAVACESATDCAGSGETSCALATCFGGAIVIGACGSTPPTCPQP